MESKTETRRDWTKKKIEEKVVSLIAKLVEVKLGILTLPFPEKDAHDLKCISVFCLFRCVVA